MRKLMVTIFILATFATAAGAGALPVSVGCKTTWGSLAEGSPATVSGHVTGVRAGRHACFDRLVVDVDGPASGYRVEYVPRLVQDGSGETVAVAGGAIIQIVVLAPTYDDAGAATVDAPALDATNVSGFRTFRDVAWAGSFEGQTNLGLGVRARLPFRVFTLAGPGDGSRLVIDVAHRW